MANTGKSGAAVAIEETASREVAEARALLETYRAQLSHDLAMQRTDFAARDLGDVRDRQFGAKGFFDTKTFAMNRHEIVPDLPHSFEF